MHIKMLSNINYKEHIINDAVFLFDEYFKEVEGTRYKGTNYSLMVMLRDMLFNHKRTIYLLYDAHRAVGFIELYINDQYGQVEPVVFVEYMYLKPTYRSGEAIVHLYSMVGMVCEDKGLDALASTYTTSSNSNNNKIVGGETLAETVRFPLDKIKRKVQQYKKRLKI